MATLELDGVRLIDQATIDLTGPITLLAGDNGQGKTSALLALKACLTGTTSCITNRHAKSDADGMCGDGRTKRATARLVSDDGNANATVQWSKSKCYDRKTSKDTTTLPRATPAAAGLPEFLRTDPKQRAQVFLDCFQIAPKQEDLASAMRMKGLEDKIDEIWRDISLQDWDSVHGFAQEEMTSMKSEWRSIAGEAWSAELGENWAPIAGGDDQLSPADFEALERAAVEAEQKAAAARAEYNAIVVPAAPGDEEPCPHCAKPIEVRGGKLHKPEPVNEAERERLASMKRAMSGKVAGLSDDARKAEAELIAANKLSERATTDRQERIDKAGEVHARITTQADLIEILGPDGVRAKKRDEMLHLVNSELATLSERLGMGPVSLVWGPEPGKQIPTVTARLDNRLFQNCCRSERWRMSLIVQILIAKRDGSNMVIVDDCDILVRERRTPLIRLLQDTGINVVAAMSISDGPGNAPDLEAAGLGRSYWIEGGKVAPLTEAKQAALSEAA